MEEIDKLLAEMERISKRMEQLERANNLYKNRQAYMQKKPWQIERDKRTHRVANKGGVIECFYPDTKEMTGDEFYSFVKDLSEQEDLNKYINEKLESYKKNKEKETD